MDSGWWNLAWYWWQVKTSVLMWLQLVLHIDLSSSLRFRGAAGLTAAWRQVCIERSVRSLLPEGSWKGWCCYAPSNINLCFPAGFNPNKQIEQLSIMNPITMGGKKDLMVNWGLKGHFFWQQHSLEFHSSVDLQNYIWKWLLTNKHCIIILSTITQKNALWR